MLREDTDFSLLYNDRLIRVLPSHTYNIFPFGIRLSADGKTSAFRYTKGKSQYASFNGSHYGPYDRIEAINISRDGKRLFTHYQNKQREFIRINEMEFGPIDWLYRDGHGIAFWVKKGAKKYVYSGNRLYGPFADIHAFASGDTGDHTAFCFTVCSETPKDYRFKDESLSDSYCYIQFDGTIRTKLPAHKRNSINIHFSEGFNPINCRSGYLLDGKFVHYSGPYVSLYREGLATIDGEKVASYHPVDQHSVAVHYNSKTIGVIRGNIELIRPSADGERIFVLYENDFQQYLQVNRKIFGPIPRSYKHWFISPGGRYCGYMADDRSVHINENKIGPYRFGVSMPDFTPDDSRYVITYSTGDDVYIRVNNSVNGPYNRDYFQVSVTPENRIMVAYIKDGYAFIDELH